MRPLFITGTGTGIGKTLAAAVVAAALEADYWKPIQAGTADGTDAQTVAGWLDPQTSRIHPEVYTLTMPASPHLAAAGDGVTINLEAIAHQLPKTRKPLVIEGAGGLYVPLNEKEFVYDLIRKLDARVILVSRNYLGSINHSLLTASACRALNLPVLGWIFNDEFGRYEEEIARWSDYPIIGKLPHLPVITRETVYNQAAGLRHRLIRSIEKI